jgi:cell division septation protein DedD
LEAHRKGGVTSENQEQPTESQQNEDSAEGTSLTDEKVVLPDSQLNSKTVLDRNDSLIESSPVDLTLQDTVHSTLASPDSLKDSISMPARPRDGYTVQIAGTRSSDEANAIVERFKLYGYDAYVAEVSREGRPFYRVRVGRFETEQEANDLKGQLLEQQQIEGWVDQGSW